jgi:hypothetical protein
MFASSDFVFGGSLIVSLDMLFSLLLVTLGAIPEANEKRHSGYEWRFGIL